MRTRGGIRNAFLELHGWLLLGVVDDLVLNLVEQLSLVQLCFSLVHDVLQTIHEKCTYFGLSQINNLDGARRIEFAVLLHETVLLANHRNRLVLGLACHNLRPMALLNFNFFKSFDWTHIIGIERLRVPPALPTLVARQLLSRRFLSVLEFADLEFDLMDLH